MTDRREEWVRKIITVRTLVKIEAVWRKPTIKIDKIKRAYTSRGCSQWRTDVSVIGKLGEVSDIPARLKRCLQKHGRLHNWQRFQR